MSKFSTHLEVWKLLAAVSRWATYLEVSLGGERPAADVAGKGLLSRMSALVDLQGAGRGEVLAAGVACVLFR